MKSHLAIAALLGAGSLSGPALAQTWMINKDVEQRLVTPQSNFETVLQGNATMGLSGGLSSVTNPFANPQRTQSYDGTNTTISWSGSNAIGQSFGTKRHFGVFGTGQNPPKILAEYWTPQNNNTTGRVPGSSSGVQYPAGTGMAFATVSNDTPDEITVLNLGFLVVNRNTVQIGQLTQTGMPPGSFVPLLLADPVLSPGELTPVLPLTMVNTSTDSVVLFMETRFSGVSSGNDYTGNTREWVASNTAAATEPGFVYCFGDGTLPTQCPCAPPNVVPNPPAAPGHGCANSLNLNGALLTATGSTVPDTLSFLVNVAPGYLGFAFLVKGNASAPGGIAASDGIRCANGALIRFGSHNAGTNGAPAGLWTYPNTAQTTPVSSATLQAPGQTAYYGLFYRNAAASFCNSSTANFSNHYQILW